MLQFTKYVFCCCCEKTWFIFQPCHKSCVCVELLIIVRTKWKLLFMPWQFILNRSVQIWLFAIFNAHVLSTNWFNLICYGLWEKCYKKNKKISKNHFVVSLFSSFCSSFYYFFSSHARFVKFKKYFIFLCIWKKRVWVSEDH